MSNLHIALGARTAVFLDRRADPQHAGAYWQANHLTDELGILLPCSLQEPTHRNRELCLLRLRIRSQPL